MKHLYIDCAGTSVLAWGKPLDMQPHLIRLAFAVEDGATGTVLDRASLVVRPLPYWPSVMPDEVMRHHVTSEYAQANGRVLHAVLDRLATAAKGADVVIAHNLRFHSRMILRAWAEMGLSAPAMPPAGICTMEKGRAVVRACIPGTTKLKWPSLAEAYEHFAHSPPALPDDPVERGDAIIEAVRRVFNGLCLGALT